MTEALAIFSALIAAAGLGFSGWQLRLIHLDREMERKLDLEGVCLSWRAVRAPNRGDIDANGKAVWTYAFRLDNPGRFPISEIDARVVFPNPVTRIRHNGNADDPNVVLGLAHAVLPGGANFEWPDRRLEMPFDGSPNRFDIRADVSFTDSEGLSHMTSWPKVSRTS